MGSISIDNLNMFFENSYNILINSKGIVTILFLILTIIYWVSFCVSLMYIFKKENIIYYYAFIPCYNICIYMSLLDIKWIYAFIPIINIPVLICANYCMARGYKVSNKKCLLTMFLPMIYLPILAMDDNLNIYHGIRKDKFLRNTHDVEDLEKKLEENENNSLEINNTNSFERDKNFKSTIDEKINTIEENAIKEDYEEQLHLNELEFLSPSEQVIKEATNNIVKDEADLVDIFESNDIRETGIEEKEKQIESNSKINVIDTANYKEYKKEGPTVSSIAFGGITANEKIESNRLEAKDGELTCPYCKSSLVNSNGICPGCGRDVHDVVYNKQRDEVDYYLKSN